MDLWTRIFGTFDIREVLDVGAETGGTVSLWLEHGAQSVHAVEPVPDNYARLVDRFGHDERVTLHRCGISDQAGVQEGLNVFNAWSLLPEDSTALERAVEFRDKTAFAVEFRTIDAIVASHSIVPGLVKIDVDGYEAKALRGARRLLERHRPVVMLEVSYLPFFFGDCCECMIRWIYERGYVITDFGLARTFEDSRAFMRNYPWDTSFDVFLWPKEAAGRWAR
ncbi:MAG TPA: FkbM family methyltransferase [Vicinamibacterales bacterium]|nr:FkbM family methyltransferase [Vicinamibacterales bacterium]